MGRWAEAEDWFDEEGEDCHQHRKDSCCDGGACGNHHHLHSGDGGGKNTSIQPGHAGPSVTIPSTREAEKSNMLQS